MFVAPAQHVFALSTRMSPILGTAASKLNGTILRQYRPGFNPPNSTPGKGDEEDLPDYWKSMERRVIDRPVRPRKVNSGPVRGNVKKTDEDMWLAAGAYDNIMPSTHKSVPTIEEEAASTITVESEPTSAGDGASPVRASTLPTASIETPQAVFPPYSGGSQASSVVPRIGRVSEVEVKEGKVSELVDTYKTVVAPSYQVPGFGGGYLLMDPITRKATSFTLWEASSALQMTCATPQYQEAMKKLSVCMEGTPSSRTLEVIAAVKGIGASGVRNQDGGSGGGVEF